MQRIFDKTDKGREEIATRKHRLAPRLRTLLLLVDGKQTTGQLLQKVAGIDEQAFAELLNGGFIQLHTHERADDSVQTDSLHSPPTESQDERYEAAEGETKFEAIHRFYHQTIQTALGLHDHQLLTRVDTAQSLEDLRAFQAPFMAAVLKIKGNDVAMRLHQQLEALFAMESPDSE